jgi:hypothetical protein
MAQAAQCMPSITMEDSHLLVCDGLFAARENEDHCVAVSSMVSGASMAGMVLS